MTRQIISSDDVNQPIIPVHHRPWRLYLIALTFLGIVFASIYGYCNYVYAEGGYSGYVRMIHRVGAIKTWEGELDKRKLGGSFDEQDIFHFSVQNEDVAKKVEAAEQSGDWVTLQYKQYLVTLPWRGKTQFIVSDVNYIGAGTRLSNK